jgi:hypothetical protein
MYNDSRPVEYDEYQDGGAAYGQDGVHQERGYFSPGSNIMDDRMVHYRKRQLPPLQRYSNSQQEFRPDAGQLSYWDMREEYQPRRQSGQLLGNIWQKFIVTFASILSLVCISWIVYNWNDGHSRNSAMQPVVIEPEQSSFKVLPDDPGGEQIPHKGRAVYARMTPGDPSIRDDESLLPPQEDPLDLPASAGVRDSIRDNVRDNTRGGIEENSIVDDKIYYVKMSAGKSKPALESELRLLRKKFANVLEGCDTAVKKVSNPRGEQKHAILIGPFNSQDAALDIARQIGDHCYIVSVRE